jgi:hypothetical protein
VKVKLEIELSIESLKALVVDLEDTDDLSLHLHALQHRILNIKEIRDLGIHYVRASLN